MCAIWKVKFIGTSTFEKRVSVLWALRCVKGMVKKTEMPIKYLFGNEFSFIEIAPENPVHIPPNTDKTDKE